MSDILTPGEALEYLKNNHPHVHPYATSYSLMRAMRRFELWDSEGTTTTARRLDQFAELYKKKLPPNTGTKKNHITFSPKAPARPGRVKRWRSVDEMIAHFQGTGKALVVPPGVASLEEIK